MEHQPILDPRLPPTMTEEDFEDFLTEAIGLYAETTGAQPVRVRTIAESKLLLKNKGLVIGLGDAEFRVSIVKTRG